MQHLLLKDVVGEFGFDLPDAVLRQIRLPGFYGPRHHVHMGMVAFIVKCRVPTKVLGRNVHGGGDVVAVGAEKISPRPGMELSQKLKVLRKKKGLSQFELAEVLCVSRQAITGWEAGTSRPSTENLQSLSRL